MSPTTIKLALLFVLVTLANPHTHMPVPDPNFGMGIISSDLYPPFAYLRHWNFQSNERSDVSKIVNDKDSFKVYIDVHHFKPEEIKVIVTDKYVQIEGKHEEIKDKGGFLFGGFLRRISLPEGVDPKTVAHEISSDGVLTISAPKKELPESEDEGNATTSQTTSSQLEETKEANNTTGYEQPTTKKMKNVINNYSTKLKRKLVHKRKAPHFP